MPRAPTAPPIPYHDAVCCQACRQELIQLRIDNELSSQILETERDYGKEDANNLTKLEGRVDVLEQRRARESGRQEAFDQVARDQAAVATKTADTAHGKARIATWAASIVFILEALDRLGVLAFLQRKHGG